MHSRPSDPRPRCRRSPPSGNFPPAGTVRRERSGRADADGLRAPVADWAATSPLVLASSIFLSGAVCDDPGSTRFCRRWLSRSAALASDSRRPFSHAVASPHERGAGPPPCAKSGVRRPVPNCLGGFGTVGEQCRGWGGLRASHEAAAVRGGGGAGLRECPGADGTGRAGGEANRAKPGGNREVSEKSLEMGCFQALAFPEEPESVPSRAAGIARDGEMRVTAQNGTVGHIIDIGQEAKTGILVEA
jgi:hypothetical protein